MKNRPFVPTLAAALALAVCTLAPLSATDKDKDDKKPLPQAPALSDEYRLGPGDKLRIEVYKDAQLSQSLQVRPDGKVTLPLIGDVTAAGLTPIELRDTIATSLKTYINNPTVTVIVVETTAALAYVMGEVNHPGSISLQGPLTIIQALALAGGLKDFADTKNIRVLRRTASGVQTIAFNYKEALKSSGAPIYLRPGDTVVVPD
jgi:polysaccharide export outer membrane protein